MSLILGSILFVGVGLIAFNWRWLVSIRELEYHKEMLNILNNNSYHPKKSVEWRIKSDNNLEIINEPNLTWGFIKYKPIPMYIKLNSSSDTLSIYSLCLYSNKLDNLCKKLLEYQHIMPQCDKNIKIYRISTEKDILKWTCQYEKPGRPLNTVFLDEKIKTKILDDVQEFLISENWYKSRNIPYRRGYLLYGHTGSGKSSLVTAICSELNLSIYWIQLNQTSPYLNDRNLINALNSVPKGQVILIENIDRTTKNKTITLTGILNALDGPIAHTGHLVFFTANDLNNLDSSLIRPGRIDNVQYIPLASTNQIINMFTHIYGNSYLSDKYSKLIENNKYPMCIIQNHLIQCRNSPQLAIDTINMYLNAINN